MEVNREFNLLAKELEPIEEHLKDREMIQILKSAIMVFKIKLKDCSDDNKADPQQLKDLFIDCFLSMGPEAKNQQKHLIIMNYIQHYIEAALFRQFI